MYKFVLFSILISLPAIGLAQAPESIPEVIVTADFRDATTLETASSISVLTEGVIEARQARHLEDIVNSVPNLNFASGTSRARYFQIRGIGERSQFASPLNPSVGLLIDNVDFSGAGTIASMIDVEQVEVLRGPQGTRYGANALAGLINIKTKDPADSFQAKFNASAAEYDTRTAGIMLTGPLSETVSYRFAGEQHVSDGYYENAFLDIDDNNERDELTLRGKLRFEPRDDWTVNVALSKIDIDNGYDAFSLDNTRTTLSDEPGHDRQDSVSLAVDSLWQFENFDVQAIASVADSDIEYGFDEDWSFVGIHPDGYSSFDNYIRDRETQSFEVRALSNDGGRLFNDSTDWVVGFYSLLSEEDLQRQYTFLPSDFFSNYDFETYALFFQLDTSLTESLELTTGLRGERRLTEYGDSENVTFDPEESLWGGKVALKYYVNDQIMTYASLARGYKAGGFNIDGSLDPDLREYDSEFLWELEVGTKASLLNDTLRLRAAVFYDQRRDQQVKSSIVRQRDDDSTEFIDFLGNAAEGTNRGLEVEANWYATNRLKIFGSLGLLDATFDNFINEFGEDLSGREQAQAPDYMYSLGLDYNYGNWFGRFSVDGKDSYFFSDRHDVQTDSRALINGRIGYRTDNWTISLWGRNLTDKDYAVRGFGSFGNDPRKGYITEPYFQWGEPRVVGVSFEYTFAE